MIASKDRSYYFGASDTCMVLGNRKTKTWCNWWMQKIGINTDHFENKYTSAGTYYERRILESLNIPLEYDRQIIIEPLRLRVNLDGNTDKRNYECKTYKLENGFKMPRKYIQQVQVQMFASELRETSIIAYGLTDGDYNNYFNPIDSERLAEYEIPYDEQWIETVYLPKLAELSDCLKEGRFPI